MSTGIQRTFGIIKPDSVSKKNIGKIVDIIEHSGFTILGMKMLKLSPEKAAAFYGVHKGKPFFDELVKFMTSGKIVVLALEGADAIAQWRKVMGATDPAKAEKGSIRNLFGAAITNNAVHGSDAPETAQQEIAFFFSTEELIS